MTIAQIKAHRRKAVQTKAAKLAANRRTLDKKAKRKK